MHVFYRYIQHTYSIEKGYFIFHMMYLRIENSNRKRSGYIKYNYAIHIFLQQPPLQKKKLWDCKIEGSRSICRHIKTLYNIFNMYTRRALPYILNIHPECELPHYTALADEQEYVCGTLRNEKLWCTILVYT